MEENHWGKLSSHMEMEDEVLNECLCQTKTFDEEFLRDILQQPQEGAAPDLNTFGETSCVIRAGGGDKLMMKNSNSSMMNNLCGENKNKATASPTTYVLSFDKSDDPHSVSAWKDVSHKLPLSSTRTNQGTKKIRSASESMDHIMSERKRRQELTRKFIALASTIPGLKKMDKAHVLREAINYVKQLKERVEVLEEDIQKNGAESSITITRSHLCIDDTNSDEWYGSNEAVPAEVEARVLGKQVLIKIHCGKQKGILLKILSQLERLHLLISTSNVLPLGSTIDITIIAQMGDEYKMVVKDLVKELRQVAMMKSCVSQ
ncbi:transcription factor bHLH18-like [Vigna umbellata]|uniref:transcription factor bHLH18-like n=1 Tax=Vigna umbellata TaxID=87088 RepID=UPI001F5F1B42|nr:transcription factor bHLH18-like [Vigna umbellata]